MAGVVSEVRAKFAATVTDFKKGVSNLRGEVAGIGEGAEKSMDQTNKAFNSFKGNLDDLKAAIIKAGAGSSDSFSELEKAVEKVQTELKDTGNIADSSMKELEAAVSRAEGDLKNLGKDTGLPEMESAISGVKADLSKLNGSSINDVEKAAKDADTAIDELGDSSVKTGEEGSKSFAGLTDSLVKVGAAVGGIAAVTGAIGGAIAVTEDYQKSLNGITAATGATDEETAALGESMKAIYGNNYGENFEEIGKTLTDAKNITGAFGEDLQYLAQDSLMLRDTFEYDMQESLRAADKLMKQFGLTGGDAMGIIATGSQKGLDYAQDLLPTIDEYSVYFKNAGYDASDMFGVFENAKKAGVFNLDYAADAFKEFGIIMLEDSSRASDALAQVGLNGAEIRAEFAKGGESAKNAMRTVAEAVGNIKDPLKQNIVGVELFGTKFEDMGSKAVVDMLQVNDSIQASTESLQQIDSVKYNTIGESLGGLKRMLQLEVIEPIQTDVMPTINKMISSLKENLPAIKKGFSDAFSMITGAVSKFTPTFEALFTIFKNVGGWAGSVLVVAFSALSAALSPVINVVTGMVAAFTEWGLFEPILTAIVAGILAYKTYMFALQVPMKVMALLTRGWAIAQGLLNAAMLLNPIGLIVAAIIGLVAAFVIAYKKSETFRAIIDKLWAVIKDGAAFVFGWLSTNLPIFIENIKQFFIGLGASIAAIWNNILAVVMPIISGFIDGAKGKFKTFVDNIMNFIAPLITFFKNTFNNIKLLVMSIVGAFLSLITGDFEGFKIAVLGIFTAIKNQVLNVITTLKDMAMKIFNLWITGVKLYFTGLKTALLFIVTGIKNGIVNGFNLMKSLATKAVEGMKNAISSTIDRIKSTFTNLKNSILSTIKGINLLQIGKDIIQGLINGISGKIGAVVDKVKGLAKQVTGTLKSMMGIKSPSRVFRAIGDFLGKGLAIGIEKTRGLVERTTAALAQSATIEPESVGIGQLTDETLGGKLPKGDDGGGSGGVGTNYNAPLMQVENLNVNDESDARAISNGLYRLQQDHDRGRGKNTN